MSWVFFGVVFTPISYYFSEQSFEWSWMPFILCTGLAQGVYLVLLAWAYTVADVSLVYPIARGVGVGCTTLLLALTGTHTLSGTGITGIVAVVAGALFLSSVEIKNKKSRVGIFLAVALGLIITSYMVIDSFGAQKIPIFFYVVAMNLSAPLFALPMMYKGRRAEILNAWKKYKWQGLAVGFAGSFSYLIVLWAYSLAPAPYVMALREISIVFAAFLGVKYLGEKIYPRKIFGISLILAGIFLLKMA